MPTNQPTKSPVATSATPTGVASDRLHLSKISKQGQYVNPQTGHLLIIDEKIEKALQSGPDLFKGFIAKDQGALDFMKVSDNPKLPIDEIRTAVSKLSLPVNF